MRMFVLLATLVAVCCGAAIKEEDAIAIGDMLFTKESYAAWTSPERSYQTTASLQWPKDAQGYTVIPYVFDATLLSTDLPNIRAGMQQWSNTTCIRFVDNAVAMATSYVRVVMPTTAGVCNSYVGNINAGANGQPINLGSGCATPEVVAHEFGHAIGLGHEHNRADRDQYLNMFMTNVDSTQTRNFNIDTFNNFSVPYNYLSNMHYFWNAFAIDRTKPTMEPKDPTMEVYISSNNPVSHYDSLLVNRALNCSAIYTKTCTNAPICQNYGYLNATCKCVCPPGTSGTLCETKTVAQLPYYPPTGNYPCGGQITVATQNVTSPMFQATTGRTMVAQCMWWIRKPSTATSAVVKFTAFNMYKKYTDGTCYYEYLDVRTKSLYVSDGTKYCATDFVAGSQITSTGDIVLKFESRVIGANTGFRFDVSFV